MCEFCDRETGPRTTRTPGQAPIPEDLRFAVAKMVEMNRAGWVVCGFQGGGDEDRQFQRVEYRRRFNG